MHEFPAQSSHECRDCLAELDVTTANGQVGSATQLQVMQSKEASCKSCNIRVTLPFTQCSSVRVTRLQWILHPAIFSTCHMSCLLLSMACEGYTPHLLCTRLQAHSACTRCWPQKLKRSGCKLPSWLLARPSTWSRAPPTHSCLAPGCSYGGLTSMVPPRGAGHLEQPCRPCRLA